MKAEHLKSTTTRRLGLAAQNKIEKQNIVIEKNLEFIPLSY